MFLADSDILGILLALLTFVVPVISSIMEKKRKNKRNAAMRQPEQQEQVYEEFVQDGETEPDRAQEIEELFNELLGLKEEPQVQEMEEESLMEKLQFEDLQQEQPMSQEKLEPVYEEKVEPVAVNVEPVQQTIFQEDENGCGEKTESLKERFRNNPKDAVIFSEILKPKFKEN